MISLLLATVAVAQVGTRDVVEVLDPSSDEISLQAFIKLPKLSEREMRALDVATEIIPKEVSGYGRRDIAGITGGVPVRCELAPDHLWISVVVRPENLSAGVSLMRAMLRDARISDETVAEVTNRVPDPEHYWRVALHPFEVDRGKVRGFEVLEAYTRYVRPDSTILAVGGAIVPGQASALWEKSVSGWTPPRMQSRSPYDAEPKLRTMNPAGVTTVSLLGPEFSPNSADFPTRLLAMYALGSGKGATVFRAVRERLGFSYRQEAIVRPTPNGFQPMVVVAMRPSGDESNRGDAIKKTILEDISSWTPRDRERALGMAEGVLLRGLFFDPLSISSMGPVDQSTEGRTYLQGYWRMKTGRDFDRSALIGSMSKVTLDDLKAAATEIVSPAQVRVLPGLK